MNTTILHEGRPVGHTPSFRFAQTAPGRAVCVTCGQLITLGQLAGERCPGAERRAA